MLCVDCNSRAVYRTCASVDVVRASKNTEARNALAFLFLPSLPSSLLTCEASSTSPRTSLISGVAASEASQAREPSRSRPPVSCFVQTCTSRVAWVSEHASSVDIAAIGSRKSRLRAPRVLPPRRDEPRASRPAGNAPAEGSLEVDVSAAERATLGHPHHATRIGVWRARAFRLPGWIPCFSANSCCPFDNRDVREDGKKRLTTTGTPRLQHELRGRSRHLCSRSRTNALHWCTPHPCVRYARGHPGPSRPPRRRTFSDLRVCEILSTSHGFER
mmetsp:Transcript_80/g.266  ORF Transcript_80/g.266 Transcript_80/m.266 type:complete len:274 (+) Transcript_80:1007-1828(+)